MSILKVTYGELSLGSKYIKKTASELENYASKMERGVSRKISNISGGQSCRTNDAFYETQLKIKELREKGKKFHNYAAQIDNFHNKVKETDKNVAKQIKEATADFANRNGFKIGKVSAFFENLAVNAINSTSLGRWVKNVYNKVENKVNDWKTEIKHWFRTGGGKYVEDIGVSLVAVVAAVAATIFTIYGGGAFIFIVAEVITYGFIIINNTINMFQSEKAYNSNKNGELVWAVRYGKIDKLAQFIRANFNNNESKTVINILNVTECISNITVGVGSIASLGKLFTTPGKTKGFISIKQLFGSQNNARSVGILGSKFKVTNGKKKVFTFRSIGNGLESLICDNEFRSKIGKSCCLFKYELIDKFKYKKSTLIQAKSLVGKVVKGDSQTSKRALDIFKSTFKSDFSSFVNNLNLKIEGKFFTGKGLSEIGMAIGDNKLPITISQLIAPNIEKLKSSIDDIKEAIINYQKYLRESNNALGSKY
ncbi:hypothetical protein [Haloimpatiens massiliensis]|uniref:hypothetical protein n=1 Tax=Haloimpatiens massiliensis TaxID=1658110 RepID=UPI000C835167|nr:hypothetical protein [Haloimpatiens massiliensis]